MRGTAEGDRGPGVISRRADGAVLGGATTTDHAGVSAHGVSDGDSDPYKVMEAANEAAGKTREAWEKTLREVREAEETVVRLPASSRREAHTELLVRQYAARKAYGNVLEAEKLAAAARQAWVETQRLVAAARQDLVETQKLVAAAPQDLVEAKNSSAPQRAAEGRAVEARPPESGAFILQLVLPKSDRECVPADLDEEFTTKIAPKFGARRARLWYWKQVFSSIGPILMNRLRKLAGFSLLYRAVVETMHRFGL